MGTWLFVTERLADNLRRVTATMVIRFFLELMLLFWNFASKWIAKGILPRLFHVNFQHLWLKICSFYILGYN